MTIERLNPLNDYLFLKYMGEKGDEEQLLAFLNAVLQRTGRGNLQSVEIIENKTFSAEIIGNKTSILDIRAKTASGTRVNIEVQLSNLGNMHKRSLFYWSREYSKGIESGQDYQELPAVIAVNIVNFEFIDTDDFHTSFHLWEDYNRECMLTDALEIHFIDMVKFKRLAEKDILNNPLHRWLTFFDKDTNSKIIEEVINMDTAIQKAQDRITFVRGSKEEFRAYQMREMAMSDLTSGLNFARREGMVIGEERGKIKGKIEGKIEGIIEGKIEGIIEGKIEGIIEGKIEVARSMKAAGMDVKQICIFTGLSRNEINKL